jgi:tRNA (guanine37-N1)-methyltransferase
VTFRASVLTLYPEMFPGALGLSLAGRALEAGTWSLETTQIRDFATDRHRTVDDTPAGGGAGMVMRPDILAKAIDHVSAAGDPRPRLLMSPRGRPLTQGTVRALAAGPGVVIVCGRFEGVDQRVIEARQLEEVSIGDYILSGGEPAAHALLDAIVRLLPGVMGNEESGTHESFEDGLLEYPHYTRPQQFEGADIPAVLTSGNHAKIAEWRRSEAEWLTAQRRPDLLPPTLENGRTIETSAALRFFGDDLDPEELTKLLGQAPTSFARKGTIEGSKRPRAAKTGRWILDIPLTAGDNLPDQIRSILSPLTDDLSIWRDLGERYQADMYCFLGMIGKLGYSLDASLSRLLADRGLSLQLDMYTLDRRDLRG